MGLWIDSDMGADDLFAILMVARARQIDGISVSFGCAELDEVRHTAARAALAFGWTWPITVGAARGILGGLVTATHILTAAGMRTRGRVLPDAQPPTAPAMPALRAWLERTEAAEILALGPLTNLATLALAEPALLERVARIVWMGGAAGRGNHTASAEFNAAADPEALAILLARNVPITFADLDACRQVDITEADVARLRGGSGRHAALLADLAGGYLDIALERGRSAMALYDPVAAALMIDPGAAEVSPVRVDVELSGALTRGRTVVDTRPGTPANAHLVTKVDAPRVRALFFDALEAA